MLRAVILLHESTENEVLLTVWSKSLQVQNGDLSVFTDPVASPTGFPFKVRPCLSLAIILETASFFYPSTDI
jgi:hypothetical protein